MKQPETEHQSQIKLALTEAVQKRSVSDLLSAIQTINQVYIGRPFGGANEVALRATVKQFIQELNNKGDWVSGIFYLNDGGFSRLAIEVMDGRIIMMPTANSTDQFKKLWQKLS